MIVGIILSAGESKRMGTPKQLLPWGKTIILQQVIDNALASGLGMILLILGYRADDIAGKIKVPSKINILVNKDFKDGMSSSIKCGIAHAPDDAEAFMILLGDQPLISASVIDRLIDVYYANEYGIIIPIYGKRRGHPLIFDSRYKIELLLMDNQGARVVINKHAQDIFEVSVDSPNVLIDIDTPQDYKESQRQLEIND